MVFLPSLQTAHRLGSSPNSLSVSVSRFLVMFLLPAWRSREKVGDGEGVCFLLPQRQCPFSFILYGRLSGFTFHDGDAILKMLS